MFIPDRFDDGGFTGGNMERPALKRLFAGIESGDIDCVVVYKVDRLSRSLLDFARMMELFDKHSVSFVSVTQQFNTTRRHWDGAYLYGQGQRQTLSLLRLPERPVTRLVVLSDKVAQRARDRDRGDRTHSRHRQE